MAGEDDVLHDPVFQRLLARRSRWRWGLSILLIGAYLGWGVGGIYFPHVYARPLPGSMMPWGMAVGLLIILLSILLSIAYVRIVSRIEDEESYERVQQL